MHPFVPEFFFTKKITKSFIFRYTFWIWRFLTVQIVDRALHTSGYRARLLCAVFAEGQLFFRDSKLHEPKHTNGTKRSTYTRNRHAGRTHAELAKKKTGSTVMIEFASWIRHGAPITRHPRSGFAPDRRKTHVQAFLCEKIIEFEPL